jgi:hypothetical protein
MGKPRKISLTARDRELLEALARRVRVFSVPQVARTWWPDADDGRRAALARLRTLASEGCVDLDHAHVHPELELREPVVSWAEGLPEPDFGPVAYKLQSRWRERVRAETIVTIARAAAPEFGGYPSPALRTDEITHDVHLAAVYLRYREHSPALASDWVNERVIRRTRPVRGGPLPDAMIRSSSVQRVVEFGGAYSKRRVRIFHAFCSAKGFAYELW